MALSPRRFAVKKAREAAQRAATRAKAPLAVQLNRAAQQPRRALPAPAKQLALPPPDPSKQLPPFAAKPRGGQWWADQKLADANVSPDAVAREQAAASRFAGFTPVADDYLGGLDTSTTTEQDWLAKALARYYKTEFGSPTDPLRDLAARNLHFDPDMTPERWSGIVNSHLLEDPIEQVLFPPNRLGGMPGAGSDLRGETMAAMPWLAKVPVTDKIYGIGGGGLDIGHFEDELYNALNPEMSGIPADLALRPESLARMSFPQAVERVGRINQFRAKQMEEQAASALNNPAIQTFKEYPDAGYRWVELRQPELSDDLLDEVDRGLVDLAVREGREIDPSHMDEVRASRARNRLQDALKFEGDTMGHCVGGYCDDVAAGRSRIFSLRDPKGQPHVTIETAPNKPNPLFTPPEVYDRFRAEAIAQLGIPGEPSDVNVLDPIIDRKIADWRKEQAAATSFPDNIIQIKGKQNRAPTDDYLPYVQDFVKSGTWSNIGDFNNTGLVKLPDGRYITRQQLDEVIASPAALQLMGGDAEAARMNLQPWNLKSFSDDDWRTVGPLFEGYAVGGRVDRNRCFSRHPMSVR